VLSAGERADLEAYLQLIDDAEPVPEPDPLLMLVAGIALLLGLGQRAGLGGDKRKPA
jgi:hypothetical protein